MKSGLPFEEILTAFQHDLTMVMDGLEELEGSETRNLVEPEKEPAADGAALQPLFLDLKEKLSLATPEAREAALILGDALGSKHRDLLQELVAMVESFRFEEAEAVLQRLLDRLDM